MQKNCFFTSIRLREGFLIINLFFSFFLFSLAQRELKEKKVELANKLCELDDTQQELKKLRKSYDTACRTLQQLLQREKNQQEGAGNRALSDSEALQNHVQKCDHENTIKSLEAEVKKKTAALQVRYEF